MDWKIVGSTFVMIFLAELGDKTQLAIFSFDVIRYFAGALFIVFGTLMIAGK